MEQTSVIEKIKKLLNMAKRATKHEREVAYLKAQEMMAKYHIEQDLLEESESRKVVETVVDLNVKLEVLALLADVIAQNFRCKNFVSFHNRKFIRPVFLGLELDAQVASEIFKDAYKYAKNEATRVANYYYKIKGYTDGIRNDWLIGFVRGLKQGFNDQVRLSCETSLMIIVPEEVNKHFSELKFTNKPLKFKSINFNGHLNVEAAGYQNGYDYSMKRRQEAIASEI